VSVAAFHNLCWLPMSVSSTVGAGLWLGCPKMKCQMHGQVDLDSCEISSKYCEPVSYPRPRILEDYILIAMLMFQVSCQAHC
jgi:hypothetical protein